MSYPHFENKHLEKALFSPEDFIKYRLNEKIKLPSKYIILFQNSAERYVKRKFKLKRTEKYHSNQFHLYIKNNVGIIRILGIGAPMATTILEETIALGGKEFVIIGTSGGLDSQGIFLCERAIRDEGTSHHYLPFEKYSYPNKSLTNEFERKIIQLGLNPIRGTTWTIDAPYRETRKEINNYKKEGVKTVEMEAAALFAVAEVRKVKIAAAFGVSDIVGGEAWDPQFDKKHVTIKLNRLIDAALNCLK